ncbi:ATP-binding protein [Streptacidiphilus melanogenes]|uniref:ATP-binding protein n=1 Tax=Streptacidiphilus melanogenes TaxID=411235 RepID=UPI001F15D3A9|nr:ATP-binding protein [Streptacidiphilus melanogenes]
MARVMYSAEGPRVDRMVVSEGRGVVGRCRDFVRACLDERGWLDGPGDEQRAVVEDVLLMTSELVTNACLHAGGPRQLVVSSTGGRLRVEVEDGTDQPPVVRAAVPAHPGGHGLRVLQRLSHAWGCEPRKDGKAVWFEIDRA